MQQTYVCPYCNRSEYKSTLFAWRGLLFCSIRCVKLHILGVAASTYEYELYLEEVEEVSSESIGICDKHCVGGACSGGQA